MSSILLEQVCNVQATNFYAAIIVIVFQNPGNVMTSVTVLIHQMKMDVAKVYGCTSNLYKSYTMNEECTWLLFGFLKFVISIEQEMLYFANPLQGDRASQSVFMF